MPYVHLVFTLPHCLNALYGAHPRWVIDTLFACTAQTLAEFAANPKWMGVADGKPAFSLVLHTWTQDLLVHLHVHAVVMACGVLEPRGQDGQGCQVGRCGPHRRVSPTIYSQGRPCRSCFGASSWPRYSRRVAPAR